jgi:hypothetical protein
MPECFCGCGGFVSFRTRSLNKAGREVSADIARVTSLLDAGVASPRGLQFTETGKQLCTALAGAVHRGRGASPELEADARALMAFSRAHFAVEAIVDAVRRSGMSTGDAAQALRQGEFDPFSRVPALPVSVPLATRRASLGAPRDAAIVGTGAPSCS